MSVGVTDKYGTVHYGLHQIKNYWWGAIIETQTPNQSTEYRVGTKAWNAVLVTGTSMRFFRIGAKVLYAYWHHMPGNHSTWSRLHPSAYPQRLMPWKFGTYRPRVPKSGVEGSYDLDFIKDMERRARDEPRNYTLPEAWRRYESLTEEVKK